MTWDTFVKEELEKPYFQELVTFLKTEDKHKVILPPKEDRLACFKLTSYDRVKVVILGQDPYHNYDQAHGLAFSVKSGKFPPSLINVFKELVNDIGVTYPKTGNLTPWAKQGVLLLNTVLTVELHQPLSHQNKGWELFTLEAIKKINEKDERVIFILWGAKAKAYATYIDQHKHRVIMSAHPSPLSARHGFFGSKPFSKANYYLEEVGQPTIDWQLS